MYLEMDVRAAINFFTVLTAAQFEALDLGSLGSEAAEEADVLPIEAVVDANVLGSKQVVVIFRRTSFHNIFKLYALIFLNTCALFTFK